MANYREILRLISIGFNNRQIADSSGATRQTVIAVLQRAATCELNYQAAEDLSGRGTTIQAKKWKPSQNIVWNTSESSPSANIILSVNQKTTDWKKKATDSVPETEHMAFLQMLIAG